MITPNPNDIPSEEQISEIIELLKYKTPCQIFQENCYPLEWCVQIENDLKQIIEEENIEE